MATPDVLPSGRWTAQWKELYEEVIDTGLCTGCAGCVIACPHDVIGYDHEQGGYKPFHLEDELGPDDCIHGQKGCTSCTRACPRFRTWEPEADDHLFGRFRREDELSGIYSDILLTRASDDMVHQMGQDGGLVSALLIWAMDEGYIDAALVSYLEGDGSTWKAKPGVATNKEEILASAGSRYTYSANTLALHEAVERGLLEARAGRDELPVVGAAGDVDAQGRQDRQADRVQHRPAVLEDVRRRHLRGALRGQVRPQEGRHQEDEHQGRLPDLDARTTSTTRCRSRSATRGRARAATTARTSRPSTPTSPPAASASTTTGRSPSSAPSSAGRS